MAANIALTRSTIHTGNMVVHTVMTAPITRMLRILRRYTTEAQTGELNHFFGLKGVAEKFQLINTDSNRDGSFKLPFLVVERKEGGILY